MNDRDVQRKQWVFSGRVQGVGFRYRAQYAAQNLGLTGWVANNWDGTVTLQAQGPMAQLDKLVPAITATSRWIMIENMRVQDLEPVQGERAFRVRSGE